MRKVERWRQEIRSGRGRARGNAGAEGKGGKCGRLQCGEWRFGASKFGEAATAFGGRGVYQRRSRENVGRRRR